jgi:hypothetical protein
MKDVTGGQRRQVKCYTIASSGFGWQYSHSHLHSAFNRERSCAKEVSRVVLYSTIPKKSSLLGQVLRKVSKLGLICTFEILRYIRSSALQIGEETHRMRQPLEMMRVFPLAPYSKVVMNQFALSSRKYCTYLNRRSGTLIGRRADGSSQGHHTKSQHTPNDLTHLITPQKLYKYGRYPQ